MFAPDKFEDPDVGVEGDDFAKVRNFILRGSKTIVTDDSGIPVRFLDRESWGVTAHGRYSGPAKITHAGGGAMDTAALYFQADLKTTYYPHVASSLSQAAAAAKHAAHGGRGGRGGHGHGRHRMVRGGEDLANVAAKMMAASSGGPRKLEAPDGQRVVFGYDEWTGRAEKFAGQNCLVAVSNDVAAPVV